MKRTTPAGLRLFTAPLLLFLTVLCLLTALSNVESGQREESLRQLEDAVRRSAVACYALEGVYPPSLSYLETHYGLQVDAARYTVVYEVFAENLMPDITVLEHTS
ncbi:MAG: hypothetical protein RR288_03835 [Oscillibacter sp.]